MIFQIFCILKTRFLLFKILEKGTDFTDFLILGAHGKNANLFGRCSSGGHYDDNDDDNADNHANDDFHLHVFPEMLTLDFHCSTMKLFSSSLKNKGFIKY